MKRRPIRKQNQNSFEIWKRVAVYGVLLLILSTAQCSFFARLHFLSATPDLILCALVAIAVLDSVPVAAMAAVGGGILIDAIGGVGVSWSPLFYLTVIVVVGLLAGKMLRGFVAYLVLLLPALLLRFGATALSLWSALSGVSPMQAFRTVLLPEALFTLVFGLPLYFFVLLCMIPLAGPQNRPRRGL